MIRILRLILVFKSGTRIIVFLQIREEWMYVFARIKVLFRLAQEVQLKLLAHEDVANIEEAEDEEADADADQVLRDAHQQVLERLQRRLLLDILRVETLTDLMLMTQHFVYNKI